MTTPETRESAKLVVTKQKDTYRKLAIDEANVEMLAKMMRNAVGTNDVRNFVCKQISMRRVNKKLDNKLIRKLMKNKLDDTCAIITRVRQLKQRLKMKLYRMNVLVMNLKKTLRECELEYKMLNARQRVKNINKVERCTMKQERIDVEACVPQGVMN